MLEAAPAPRAAWDIAPRLAALRPALRLGAMAGLGGVAALGQAPFDLPLFTLAALALGLAVLAQITRVWPAFWSGWALAFGHFMVSWTWLVEPFLVDPARHGWMAPFGITLLSGAMALYWAAAAALASRIGQRLPPRLAGLVLLIVLAEYLRGRLFTGFPWGMVAYAWINTPLAQLLAWVGPHGLNLLTFGVAGLCAYWLITRRGGWATLAVLALGAIAAVLLRPGPPPPADAEAPRIRMVQSNAAQDEKWNPETIALFLDRHLSFTAAGEEPADLVIWSETALPYLLEDSGPELDRAAEAARGAPVLLGVQRRQDRDYFNSLVMVAPGGEVQAVYDKNHLVPFGEYLPFGGVMRRLGLSGLADNFGGGFRAGDGRALIEVPGIGPILPLICYESVFPAELGAMPARPRLMVLITNDAWFGRFSGPYQHLAQGRARAIEQGVPMARVAQTGISAMIDGRGRVLETIALGEAGWRDAPLPPALPPTLYARAGDLPVVLLLIGSLTGIFAAAYPRLVDPSRSEE